MVPSPCTKICRIDPVRGDCEGCFRTLDEIANWYRVSDQTRRVIVAACESRRVTAGSRVVP